MAVLKSSLSTSSLEHTIPRVQRRVTLYSVRFVIRSLIKLLQDVINTKSIPRTTLKLCTIQEKF